jgi:hypothetical protein
MQYANDGARLLARAVEEAGSQAAVAARCKFSRVYVHLYLNGRSPGLENALVMKRRLKIPPDAWLKPAREEVAA